MGAQSSREAPPSHTSGAETALTPHGGDDTRLPGWDSFPLSTRRLVVELIVQTACRQMRGRPTDRLGGARG